MSQLHWPRRPQPRRPQPSRALRCVPCNTAPANSAGQPRQLPIRLLSHRRPLSLVGQEKCRVPLGKSKRTDVRKWPTLARRWAVPSPCHSRAIQRRCIGCSQVLQGRQDGLSLAEWSAALLKRSESACCPLPSANTGQNACQCHARPFKRSCWPWASRALDQENAE